MTTIPTFDWQRHADSHKCVLITGKRFSGKTTLAIESMKDCTWVSEWLVIVPDQETATLYQKALGSKCVVFVLEYRADQSALDKILNTVEEKLKNPSQGFVIDNVSPHRVNEHFAFLVNYRKMLFLVFQYIRVLDPNMRVNMDIVMMTEARGLRSFWEDYSENPNYTQLEKDVYSILQQNQKGGSRVAVVFDVAHSQQPLYQYEYSTQSKPTLTPVVIKSRL